MSGDGVCPFYVDRYWRDAQFRRELDYCAERGIPHSWFLGGEHRWDDEDRAKLMAWWMCQAEMCPTCRTRYDDWNPKKGGDRHAYYAQSYVCEGCRAGEDAYAAASDNAREAQLEPRGLKVRLVPKATYQPGLK